MKVVFVSHKIDFWMHCMLNIQKSNLGTWHIQENILLTQLTKVVKVGKM